MIRRICKLMLALWVCALPVIMTEAEPITREQARQRALTFQMKKGDTRQIKAVTNEKRLAARKHLVSSGVEPYYVFEREQNEGYLIISGDDQTIDVLGYASSGSFDYNQLPPALQQLLDDYARQIEAIQKGAVIARLPANHAKVEQLMQSKWSQGSPYNLTCPLDAGSRSVTGCVATAMAQILYYNREKSVTETTAAIPAYSTYTKGIAVPAIPAGAPIDWDNMKDTYSSATDLQKQAVANLMLYCGAGAKMDYTNSSSGAQSRDAYEAIKKYFGYGSSVQFVTYQNVSSDDEWDRIVYAEIAAGRPVYISGHNTSAGHAFVADGYENQRYHINWGWGGQSDGYYYLTNLTPGDGQGIGGSSDGYNSYKEIIIGLEPENYETKAMSFSDAEVRRLCLAHWDSDNDGKLTYGEAAQVTDLGTVFQSNTTITSFSELYYFTGLKHLADDAFSGCTALTTMRMPKTLASIGQRTFKNCAKLRQITLPTSVTAIGQEAFAGCTMVQTFELPTGLTAIEDGCFKNCTSITSVELPLSIESIGNEAFAGCTQLNSFTVKTYHPESITMGTSIFGGDNLSGASLYVMQGTKSFYQSHSSWSSFGKIVEMRELSGGEFATLTAGQTYYIYNVGTGRYLTKGEAYGTQAVAASTPMRFVIKRTANMAEDVYYLTSPDTGKSGIYLYRTSSDANVGSGVKSVFVDGGSLSSSTAYWTIRPVADHIYTIQVPATVSGSYVEGQYLGIQTDHRSNAASPTYGAYYDVDYATHQKGCQWQLVLYDADKMERFTQAEILANLLSLARKANKKCGEEQAVYDNLESTTAEIMAAQTTLRKKLNFINFANQQVRQQCISYYDSDTNGEISYKEAAETAELTYGFSFKNNTSITSFDELQYFTSIPSIYDNTFYSCTNLQSVILPPALENIYYRAFYNCKKLKAINIPAYVGLIDDQCFYGCSSLSEVTIEATDPGRIALGNNVFEGVNLSTATLYVPYGTKELYQNANVWKQFGQIVEVRSTHTQPQFSAIVPNKTGYLYNVGLRKYITMGEAYGTQSVVARSGRVYQLKRTTLQGAEVIYLQDKETGKVVFRTNKDNKVGEGVAACFGDGSLSTSAYWTVDSVKDCTYTLQVPVSDALYKEGKYLGTDEYHENSYTYKTNGIYFDVAGVTDNTLWGFISEEDMERARQTDAIISQLKVMLTRAVNEQIDVTAEQAVYDNLESTVTELSAALKSVREKLHLITFTDDRIKELCLANWDSDEDGELTLEEAAAVTTIGEIFRGNINIQYFEELKYFTSLTDIPADAFRTSSSLQTLYIPKNVKSIGNFAFSGCSKLQNLVILQDEEMIPYGSSMLTANATVFLPQTILASYEADDTWPTRVKRLTEYTGKPIVTAEATRIYGRTSGNISVIVLGAPVEGMPETSCPDLSVATNPVGTYPIEVKTGSITTADVELRQGVLTITPAALTITAKSYTRQAGEANPLFEVTYKGFRNKETADVLLKQPVITCDADETSTAGTYEISVSGAEAQNYDITYVNGTLTITGTNAIHQVLTDGHDAPLYDMQGRRIREPQRGLYIKGHKKVVIR